MADSFGNSTSAVPNPVFKHAPGNNPPQTNVITSHSLSIIGPNGQRIGLINGWTPNQTRTITPIYELNVESSGVPYENVPGNLGGLTITVNRFDIWTEKLETAFGTNDLTVLANQNKPFIVTEIWVHPDTTKDRYDYYGCWFSSLGRAYQAADGRVVNVNAQIMYAYKKKG